MRECLQVVHHAYRIVRSVNFKNSKEKCAAVIRLHEKIIWTAIMAYLFTWLSRRRHFSEAADRRGHGARFSKHLLRMSLKWFQVTEEQWYHYLSRKNKNQKSYLEECRSWSSHLRITTGVLDWHAGIHHAHGLRTANVPREWWERPLACGTHDLRLLGADWPLKLLLLLLLLMIPREGGRRRCNRASTSQTNTKERAFCLQ